MASFPGATVYYHHPPPIPLALVDVAIIGGMEPGNEYYSAQAVLTISDCNYNYCTPLTSIWSVTVCIAFGGSSGCKISWRTITLDLCRIESFTCRHRLRAPTVCPCHVPFMPVLAHQAWVTRLARYTAILETRDAGNLCIQYLKYRCKSCSFQAGQIE